MVKERALIRLLKFAYGSTSTQSAKDDLASAEDGESLCKDLEEALKDPGPLFCANADGTMIRLKEDAAGARVVEHCLFEIEPNTREWELTEILMLLVLNRDLTVDDVDGMDKAITFLNSAEGDLLGLLEEYNVSAFDTESPLLVPVALAMFIASKCPAVKEFARRAMKVLEPYDKCIKVLRNI